MTPCPLEGITPQTSEPFGVYGFYFAIGNVNVNVLP